VALWTALAPSGLKGVTSAVFMLWSFSHLRAIWRRVVPMRCLRYSGRTWTPPFRIPVFDWLLSLGLTQPTGLFSR